MFISSFFFRYNMFPFAYLFIRISLESCNTEIPFYFLIFISLCRIYVIDIGKRKYIILRDTRVSVKCELIILEAKSLKMYCEEIQNICVQNLSVST